MTKKTYRTNVAPGAFPFPIVNGPGESRYLTWIRNHSNYMAVRGLLDYVRAAAVLVRGILVNFLVILPYLLAFSLLVALWYFYVKQFQITFIVLIAGIIAVVLFPLLTPLYRIIRHRKRIETGSDSSVWLRDKFERFFGFIFLLIMAFVAFESITYFLDYFHKFVHGDVLGWPHFASIGGVAVAVFTAADKLMNVLGGVAQKIAILAVGALGLLVPLLVVLFVSDFLVFGLPDPIWTERVDIAFAVIRWVIVLAILTGLVFHSISIKELALALTALVAVIAIGSIIKETGWGVYDKKYDHEYNLESLYLENQDLTPTARREIPELIRNTSKQPGPRLQALIDDLESRRKARKLFQEVLSDAPHSFVEAHGSSLLRNMSQLDYYSQFVPSLLGLVAKLDDIPTEQSAMHDDIAEKLLKDVNWQIYHLVSALRLAEIRSLSSIEASDEIIRKLFQLNADCIRYLITRHELEQKLCKNEPLLYEEIVVEETEPKLRLENLKDLVDNPSWEELKVFLRLAGLTIYNDLPFDDIYHQFVPIDYAFYDDIRWDAVEFLEPDHRDVLEMRFAQYSVTDIAAELEMDVETVQALIFEAQPIFDEVLNRLQVVQDFKSAIDQIGLEALGNLILDARKELATTAFYSRRDYPDIYKSELAKMVRQSGMQVHFPFVLIFAVLLWVLAWLTADVNLTSIHGLYRDRLAAAFLVGEDTKGDVDIEKDLDLEEICRYEAGSTAPYHLINTALNLQSSKDIGLRDRNSGYFVFSKKFIGGKRTRYCRSEDMEAVFPQMGLATAMAISAAAASPNMGRATSPALVAIMALLNIRLGYWIPNPGRLEEWISVQKRAAKKEKGYLFNEVFTEELVEITRRWENYKPYPDRYLSAFEEDCRKPTPRHGLMGIGFSGGGIRSATINLGITQVLNRRGIFDHVDYMSTVSGGGYLGSSISALMRRKTKTVSEVAGTVRRETNSAGEQVVRILPKPELKLASAFRLSREKAEPREYRYAGYANIAVEDGDWVKKGRRLVATGTAPNDELKSIGAFFRWQVRPGALLREIGGRLDENHRWVNVSDGGHIENLASIELLRRRCKYIIIGDGEADPEHQFNGLATLVRSARIDLGVDIKINLDELRLAEKGKRKGLAGRHWAIGRIDYPPPDHKDSGYLLYLKSSVTGDEDEVIKQYRLASPSFPHETTADQFFGEGQFEAYRSLGQHIAEQVIKESNLPGAMDDNISFADFEDWFQSLWENRPKKKSKSRNV